MPRSGQDPMTADRAIAFAGARAPIEAEWRQLGRNGRIVAVLGGGNRLEGGVPADSRLVGLEAPERYVL